MARIHPEFLEHQRKRFMRQDAPRYIRPDAYRFVRPGHEHLLPPEYWERYGPARPHEPTRNFVSASIWRRGEPRSETPAADDPRSFEAQVRELRCELAALRVCLAPKKLFDGCAKANFNPNQPRVPAGNPDGGQWTDGPRRAGAGESDLDEGGDSGDESTDVSAVRRRTPPGLGHNEGPPLEDPPDIPDTAPATPRLRNRILVEAAIWLAKAAAREAAAGPIVGTFLNVLSAALWIQEGLPYVWAYLDEPKSLEELQAAAAAPRKGYDTHHIVEKTSAAKDGFSRSRIEGSDNKVLVPTFKHWEINRWFETKNKTYGGLTPRQYMRGKGWEERRRVGLDALIEAGVLKQ